MLSTKLKPAIRTKRRDLLSTGVLFLHDTVQTLVKLGFEVLDHPAYSPVLPPSDCHLFGRFKDIAMGRRFTSDEEVKEAVHEWLATKSNAFSSADIQKLVERWNKCTKKHWDYVKNDIIVRSLLLLK
jgi:histone-lysine N-methyltransferase SETMAR